MFPNVLVPTPLHGYTQQHSTFLTSSSAFLMDNLLNNPPREAESPGAYPHTTSPDYASSGSPSPTDYRVRKTDCLSPEAEAEVEAEAGDSSGGVDDHDHSGDSTRLQTNYEANSDGRPDLDDGWSSKRGEFFESYFKATQSGNSNTRFSLKLHSSIQNVNELNL